MLHIIKAITNSHNFQMILILLNKIIKTSRDKKIAQQKFLHLR